MFVWRKRASATWLAANEMALREMAGSRLAIISGPELRNAVAEVAGSDRDELQKIQKPFGGRIEKLPRNWLQKVLRQQRSKPLKIGKRLVVSRNSRFPAAVSNKPAAGVLPPLIIPASAAFGTGDHATTAMSLRMLETLTRKRVARSAQRSTRRRVRSPETEFSLLDLGTGSGILALAAKRFGAGRVMAIDNDPVAIRIAKTNARRNKLHEIDFRVADVVQWRFPRRIDVVTANLFSELLIEILPKLKCASWLIFSGVLRQQEHNFIDALKRNRMVVAEVRRRGKWLAILAKGTPLSCQRNRGMLRTIVDHMV